MTAMGWKPERQISMPRRQLAVSGFQCRDAAPHPVTLERRITRILFPNIRVICPMAQLLPRIFFQGIKAKWIWHSGIKFVLLDVTAINHALKRL